MWTKISTADLKTILGVIKQGQTNFMITWEYDERTYVCSASHFPKLIMFTTTDTKFTIYSNRENKK